MAWSIYRNSKLRGGSSSVHEYDVKGTSREIEITFTGWARRGGRLVNTYIFKRSDLRNWYGHTQGTFYYNELIDLADQGFGLNTFLTKRRVRFSSNYTKRQFNT